ncbi:MAG TPA: hypothetical protein VIL10_06385 [Marmoricola sp.]|jgi:aryl-alcohol dehydrogenase-like predicted oxidoreductase
MTATRILGTRFGVSTIGLACMGMSSLPPSPDRQEMVGLIRAAG